jgi:hypothetical protein
MYGSRYMIVALSFLIVSSSFAFVVVAVLRYRDIQKSVGNEIFDLVYEFSRSHPTKPPQQ